MLVSKKHAVVRALVMCVVVIVYRYVDFSGNANTMLPSSNNKKVVHIAYLRVPKTGSTTLYALFYRFALKNKLKMYISKSHSFIPSWEQRLLMKKGTYIDIFAEHTHYNSKFFSHILPTDSALIAGVREPIQRIISEAFFSRKRAAMRTVRNLSDEIFIHKVLRNRRKYRIEEHTMASFYGMGKMTDTFLIRQYLDILNSRFWLVLVLEKFNESLVLLKRILNWSFADILFNAQNVGKYENVYLSNKEKQNLYSTNIADFEIYNYFKTELENKIQREGNDFQAEVVHFKKILNTVTTFCDKNTINDSKKLEFPPSKWDHSFEFLSSECEMVFKFDERIIRKRYYNEP